MLQPPNAVMLFAAGFGTRMRHLTENTPKPMVKVAGQPLIDHALSLAEAINPQVMAANLHYFPEVLERHLADRPVQLSLEIPDILETGGGLRAALPLLGYGPVFTMNTDAIWKGPNPLKLLQQAWDPSRMDALLMCVDPQDAVGHKGQGDFTPRTSGSAQRGPGLIYGGVQIIKTGELHNIQDRVFSLNLIWDKMLTQNRLHVLRYPGKWCDVGTPEGVTLAENLLKADDV